jgi:hypothetical protein
MARRPQWQRSQELLFRTCAAERFDLPGKAILDGQYKVPPVLQTQ